MLLALSSGGLALVMVPANLEGEVFEAFLTEVLKYGKLVA